MNEELLIEAFQTALSQSQASFGMADALLLAFAVVAGMLVSFIVIGGLIYKFIFPKPNSNGKIVLQQQDVKKAEEAHNLITTKDVHGVHLFLRIPEYMEKISKGIESMNTTMTNLYNHQNERITGIEKDVENMKK